MPSSSVPARTPLKTPTSPPRPGELPVLDWVARLGAAGIEPARIALGLSPSVAYSHAQRLTAAGSLRRMPVNVEPVASSRSRPGAQPSPASAASPRSDRAAAAHHRSPRPSLSWVAARAEAKGWPWLGPAALHHDPRWTLTRGDGARHRPDLGLLIDDQSQAVEVELHAQVASPARRDPRRVSNEIWSGELHGVVYVVEKRYVERLVTRARARIDRRSGDGRPARQRHHSRPPARCGADTMRTEPETRVTLTRTQILRARDVAALLHVPTSTVHEWARTGKLPAASAAGIDCSSSTRSSNGSTPRTEPAAAAVDCGTRVVAVASPRELEHSRAPRTHRGVRREHGLARCRRRSAHYRESMPRGWNAEARWPSR